MTRQIICLECAKREPGRYPGEWANRLWGHARGFKNGDFVCDLCNATIPKGTMCVAQSFGLDRDPYQPWEDEFIYHGEEPLPGVVDGTIRIYGEDGNLEEEIEPK